MLNTIIFMMLLYQNKINRLTTQTTGLTKIGLNKNKGYRPFSHTKINILNQGVVNSMPITNYKARE